MTGIGNDGDLPVPTNCQAEQALLGAILRDNRTLEQVASLLAPDRFADPVHVQIYGAICRRVADGRIADATAMWVDLEHSTVLDEVGGLSYLAALVTAAASTVNVVEYGRSIHDAWVRRVLIGLGEHLAALAADTTQSAFGGSVSEFGKASGVDQAGFVANRLRGLLATIEAAAGHPA